MKTELEVGPGTKSTEEKATMRIVAIGPLLPDKAAAIDGSAQKEPVLLRRGEIDLAMAAMAPALVVDVADPGGGAKMARLELRFSKVGDFRPSALATRVPQIAAPKSGAAAGASAPRPSASAIDEREGKTTGSLIDMILDATPMRPPAAPRQDSSAALLQSVVEHPDVRRLEAAWRGLKMLVDRAPDGVVVEAIAAEDDEVDGVLAALEERLDGGLDPVDLLVIDHRIGASVRDRERLEAWAERAASMSAPLIVGASPEILGFDDLASLAKTKRRVRASDDPRAVALSNTAAKEATRWVTLAMNPPLARARITRDDGPFEEGLELYAGAAYGVAALAAQSFGRTGWACQLTGTVYGALGDLPVGRAAGHDSVAISTETMVRDDAAAEAASAGVCILTPAANRDVVLVPYAPTLYRGPIGPSGTSAAAKGTLADQLFLARVSWAVTQLADAIPAGTPEAAAKEVAELTLAGLFTGGGRAPQVAVRIAAGDAPRLEVTVRPKGFLGVSLEEATLAARLG